MRRRMIATIMTVACLLTGCASIPSEAPDLSVQLGNRISALEAAHTRLLDEFFNEKRRRVDEFIQETWVPTFAREFFNDPNVAAIWEQVVHSNDANDRLKFIVMTGPALQRKINKKRLELIQPLDELEAAIKSRLESDYDQAKAINNTLTSFLISASEVNENRERYLNMAGVTNQELNQFVSEADGAVSDLLASSQGIQNRAKNVEEYRSKIQEIIKNVQQVR